MLAAILLTLILLLLSLSSYRHRNGSSTPLIQPFNIHTNLAHLHPQHWSPALQAIYNALAREVAAAVATPNNELNESNGSNPSLNPQKTMSFHLGGRPVEVYQPTRGSPSAASAPLHPSTPTRAPRRPRQPLPDSGPPWNPSPALRRVEGVGQLRGGEDCEIRPSYASVQGQKALPTFSFNDLPIPISIPAAAASVYDGAPRHTRHRHQHRHSNLGLSEEGQGEVWHNGLAVRSENARRGDDERKLWNIEPDAPVQMSQFGRVRGEKRKRRSGIGYVYPSRRTGTGSMMRRVAARFGKQLGKLDEGSVREGEGRSENAHETHTRIQVSVAELEANEAVPSASPNVSPIRQHAPVLPSALGSHPQPPFSLSSPPLFGDPAFQFATAPPAPINSPAPAHIWSRRDLGSLKRKLNRAVGLSDNSSPPEAETSAFGRLLGHASSSRQAGTGGHEGKGKNSLWRWSSGKKKDKGKSRSFEVDRSRYDSHQGVMVWDEDGDEQGSGPLRTTN